MQKVCYQCSISGLTSCGCSYPKVTTSNSSKQMIQAKYIFTIEIDDNGKRTINCELPPHDIKTLGGLKVLKKEIDEVHSFCEIMYNDCLEMIFYFPNRQGNVQTVEQLNDSNSQLIQ